MRLFHDSDRKKEFFWFGTIMLLACGLAYLLGGVAVLILMVVVCLAFFGLDDFFAKRRKQRMDTLAEQIHEVLQSKNKKIRSDNAKGELENLQCEIAKMTENLRDTQAALMQEKLRMPNVLADITHQLRGPLTTVNLLMSMLSATGLSDQRRIELLRKLAVVLKRIEQLILWQMKLTKLELHAVEFEPQKISMQTFLERAAEPIMAAAASKNIELMIQGDGTLECDLAWSSEAITNVLKNSVEHTADNGQIQVTMLENDRYAEILVEDTGTGISANDMPHIFERFYKGAGAGESNLGIGLAMAQMTVQEQGGTIQVENRPEGGVVVTIRFFKGAV